MKYIQLKKEPKRSLIDTIFQFGCGPNYVLNRQHSFELMIKEQGLTFWFRFWLMFSFHPGCPQLKEIQHKWPTLRHPININIHLHFLQGSVEDTIKYCLEKAIASLRMKDKSVASYGQPFKDNLQEASEMAFGASLCIIFYKWLYAKEVDSTCNSYWTIPQEYLKPKFKPGLLEEFVVDRWGEILIELLGVKLSQVPWLVTLLYGRDKFNESKEEKRPYPVFMHDVTDLLILMKTQWREKISNIDEKRLPEGMNIKQEGRIKHEVPENVSVDSSDSESGFKCYRPSKNSMFSRQCSFCKLPENKKKSSILCKQCKDEKWNEPRYYCSVTCQLEHWFQEHYKEHYYHAKKY